MEALILVGCVAANLLIAVITVVVGDRLCRSRSGFARYGRSVLMSALANGLVTAVGVWLWQHDVLHLPNDSAIYALIEFGVLVLVLDVAMFATHWLMHRPILFPLVHHYHHQVVEPTPVTLFHLSFIEALGFGGLFLGVLLMHPWQRGAVIAYVVFNLIFGVVAHLGTEARWQFFVTRMHLLHHRQPEKNFGFYTVLWDRLFRTYQ